MVQYTAMAPIKMDTADGTGDNIDGSSDSVTIPNDASGVKAKFVHVSVSEDAYVLANAAGDTITTTNGIIVTPESGGIILDVTGYAKIYYLQVSTGGRICVKPVGG